MALSVARKHLRKVGLEDWVYKLEVSSTTVELAAQAVGYELARITKMLSFMVNQKTVLIVAAGDAKVGNYKYKEQFHIKARMLSLDEVVEMVGHSVGGVCPLGIREGVSVYLDESLRRFDVVYLTCGSTSSAVKLTIPGLKTASEYLKWIDVCKGWRGEGGNVYRYI